MSASQKINVKVDFPFDLNSLFNLNYSFDILKQAIEFLAKTQAEHSKILSNFDSKQGQNSNSDSDAQQKEIEKILKQLKDHDKRISENENGLLMMKGLGSMGGGSGINDDNTKKILETFETLVENLKKECYQKFADRDTQSEMESQIKDLTDQINNIDSKTNTNIEELKTQFQDLESQCSSNFDDIFARLKQLEEEMKNKLDITTFQNEVASIRSMIGNAEADDQKSKLSAQKPSSAATKDFNSNEVTKLKEIINKFPAFEDNLSKILKDFKSLNIQQLKDQLESITQQLTTFASKDDLKNLEALIKALQIKSEEHSIEIQKLKELLNQFLSASNDSTKKPVASSNDVLLLRSRIEFLESSLTALKKQLQEHKLLLDEWKSKPRDKDSNEGMDSQLFNNLESDLSKLKSEFIIFKEETSITIMNLTVAVNKKSDKEDLLLIEQRILDKINEIVKQLITQFAEKGDTKKRLLNLEKTVKQIFEMIMSREENSRGQSEEDAMFTKKPLQGISCASCERNITNLSSTQADFQPWKKLPYRENGNERIARYGPGFSKILSMLRPDQANEQSRLEVPNMKQDYQDFSQTQDFRNNSNHQEHSITIDMPSNVSSAKKNSRTGYHFYKKSAGATLNKTTFKPSQTLDESPPRVGWQDHDGLPSLNIKKPQ